MLNSVNIITSKDNHKIKHIRKLKNSKREREERKQYLIEGITMLQEALKEKIEIDTIVICEDCIDKDKIDQSLFYEIAKYNCIYVGKEIFKLLTDVSTPQGLIAVVNKKRVEPKITYSEDLVLILNDIQDPGNMGTILRTLDAIGITQVLYTSNTVEIYNPKVVRSTMGGIFRITPIELKDIKREIKTLKENGYKIISTALNSTTNVYDVNYMKSVIIIGNEANGVSDELLKLSDMVIKIPILGNTESLNASVATGIILYEHIRQKMKE